MNIKIIIGLALGLIAVQSAQADFYFSKPKNYVNALVPPEHGGLVGNGGGTVVCRDAQNSIKSIELLDFYEARVHRDAKLDIDSIPGDWKAKVQAIIARIKPKSEMRYQLYTLWFERFEKEQKMESDITYSTVPDSGYIGVPTGCGYEQAAIQKQPNFAGEYRYFINADLWSAMTDSQKAGLVLHEIFYREAIGYGHSDSIRTRYMTALYSSEAFASLDTDAYRKILVQAHYETTDVAAPKSFTGLITSFLRTKRLWQAAPDEMNVPERIEFKDRILVKLGTCSEDCKTFTAEETLPNPFGISGVLSNDTDYLVAGDSAIRDSMPTSSVNQDGVITTDPSNALTDVKYTLSDFGSKSMNFSTHDKLFTASELSQTGKEANQVRNFTLVFDQAGKSYWSVIEAKVVGLTRSITADDGQSYSMINLVYASENCALMQVVFDSGVPVQLSSSPLGTLACRNVWQNVLVDFSNTFTNGSASVSELAGSRTRIAMDPARPGAFLNSDVPYASWMSGNFFIHCEKEGVNCLKATYDAARNVKSIRTVASEVSIGRYWVIIDPTKPPQDNFTGFAAANTDIELYLDGRVHRFVNSRATVYSVNGQLVNVPAGAKVELNADGSVILIQ